METRNVTLTLEKAKEFYNSGNTALKEVALQAFTKEELSADKYLSIKTFTDACEALGLDKHNQWKILNSIEYEAKGGLGRHLSAIYKLDIIRKALNGRDWNPSFTNESIWSSYVKLCETFSDVPPDTKVIGQVIINDQRYHVVGGLCAVQCNGDGICRSVWNSGAYNSDADLGLFCCKSAKIAQYMSKQFGKIIFDACYAHHIDSYKWV